MDLKVKVLNWRKSNFDGIEQELSKVDRRRMFACKGTAGKWQAFKNEIIRVQRQRVLVKVKGKAGREEEVLNILKHIKMDKSLGLDQVYSRTLWTAREVIAGPLAEIFVSLIAT
eukprot:g17758.t1